MALVNEHFLKLPGSYLFSDIAKRVNTFKITQSETGHHPTGHRRRNPSAGPGVRRSDA